MTRPEPAVPRARRWHTLPPPSTTTSQTLQRHAQAGGVSEGRPRRSPDGRQVPRARSTRTRACVPRQPAVSTLLVRRRMRRPAPVTVAPLPLTRACVGVAPVRVMRRRGRDEAPSLILLPPPALPNRMHGILTRGRSRLAQCAPADAHSPPARVCPGCGTSTRMFSSRSTSRTRTRPPPRARRGTARASSSPAPPKQEDSSPIPGHRQRDQPARRRKHAMQKRPKPPYVRRDDTSRAMSARRRGWPYCGKLSNRSISLIGPSLDEVRDTVFARRLLPGRAKRLGEG